MWDLHSLDSKQNYLYCQEAIICGQKQIIKACRACLVLVIYWQRAAGMPTAVWSERRYDCTSLCFCTLCVWIAGSLPYSISLLYTVSFFLSSTVRALLSFPMSLFPLVPPFLPLFTESSFCFFVFPSTPCLSVLGHICAFTTVCLKIIPPALWHTDPRR